VPLSSLASVSARAFAVFIGVAALIGLLAFGLVSKGEARLTVGEEVPATELPVLGGQAGETGSLADHEGKWVLINVWASWCAPCRDEAPALQDFYERQLDRGADFEVLGIDTQETGEGGLGFVDEFGLTYAQLHDGDGAYAKDDLKTTGVPESFLVDPDGNLALAIPGAVTAEQLDQRVEPLIGQP
jgi:cytochrome c biogenesis protein CcmG, thiol:disulfide interchange protein DsbE